MYTQIEYNSPEYVYVTSCTVGGDIRTYFGAMLYLAMKWRNFKKKSFEEGYDHEADFIKKCAPRGSFTEQLEEAEGNQCNLWVKINPPDTDHRLLF